MAKYLKEEGVHKEKQDIFDAGLDSSDYFHIDDTGGRHKGVNYHALDTRDKTLHEVESNYTTIAQ